MTPERSGRYGLCEDVENARLHSLDQLQLLDSAPEERFARITSTARRFFGLPMATISLIDRDRQWFKQNDGLEGLGSQLPREKTICQTTIARFYDHPDQPEFIVEDAAAVPEFAALPGVGGAVGVRFYAGYPLRGPDGHAVGTFCLYDTKPSSFDGAQLAAFREMAAWAQRELEQAEDLQRAAAIQRNLLPRPLANLPGYRMRTLCVPALAVGGDFFDHYPVQDGLVFTVADVMGKGIGAAIVAASVRSALRGACLAADQMHHGFNIGQITTWVGNHLTDDLASVDTFVTLFHAHLHTASGMLTYVDAGHGLALIVRRDRTPVPLKNTGLPIGILPGRTWHAHQVQLQPGDTLSIMSDGMLELGTEKVTIRKAVEFGVNHPDPDGLCAAVLDLAAQKAPLDDITLLVIRRNDEP